MVLGTHELPFKRLLTKMEQLRQSETITEEVVVQAGHTEFASEHMKMIPFMSFEKMNELYDRARVIVAHGGTGSIITGVKKNKPVIAVPRLAEFGEHNDNHQLEIVEQFRETGHIIGIDSPEKLDQALQQAETFRPVPFQSGRDQIMQLIEDFIDHS
ncbi:PssE/Cps14G family polysaccharide biosynthesis glycosyltransferase [Alteribacillus iranensis]|uniref:PssE/Cps14G family polysaccharide biosynthesis glycosyltransferase n=1 Tax=Alteribacillus iranensis TaxID=930128 RepID=UPI001FE23C4A|nr:PssE/Cps14G family polysaccharide biosynthesis glycosyltransferase [Alteribacillus iranensis]